MLQVHKNATGDFVEAQLALIAGLNNGMSFISCGIAGKLIETLGCRLVTAMGIILGGCGALIAGFFPCGPIWIWWVSYGFMTGLGNALTFVPVIVVLEQYFKKWFAFAYGVVTSGSTLGFILYPIIYQMIIYFGGDRVDYIHPKATPQGISVLMFFIAANYLLLLVFLPFFGSPFNIQARKRASQFSVIHSFQIPISTKKSFSSITSMKESIGIMITHFCKFCLKFTMSLFDIPVAGMKYTTNSMEKSDDSTGMLWEWKLFSQRNFSLFVGASTIYSIINELPDTYIIDLANEIFPKSPTNLMITAYGISSTFAKLGFGFLADMVPQTLFTKVLIYSTGFATKGLATSITPLVFKTSNSFSSSIFINFLYGICDGTNIVLEAPLIRSILGRGQLAQGLAIVTLFTGIAALFGPSLIGIVYDLFNGYTYPFAIGGIIMVFTGLIFYLTDFRKSQTDKSRSPTRLPTL